MPSPGIGPRDGDPDASDATPAKGADGDTRGPRHAAAVELTDAAVRLGGATVWSGVDLVVPAGEFVAILGPNGAGKSTLLRVLLGLLDLSHGGVRVLGGPAGAHNERIGYLPQRRVFDSSTRIRGVDIVRLGLDGRRWGVPLPAVGPLLSTRARAARECVAEVIERVGAQAYAGRPIGECSGGEQQRLLIAQALVQRPRMLILDEPLDGLDLPNQAAVTALVQDICRSAGVTVLLVAHDVNPLLPYVDRVLYLAGARAAMGPVREVITSATLSRLYGAPIEVLRTTDGRLVVVGQPEAPHQHGPRHVLR
ncbi:MAG TPA: ATP-binding cassette domain-containing protein [Solirubrobacteraceae bacterium]|jgi:zinc/manganese transport system ATP-binding protein|nr:ATP-binding cassette domain-containing protein [Solirubrobacteraceae bacterium]